MPELPEVETIKLGLSRLIVGKRIEAVDYDNVKSFPNSEDDIHSYLLGSNVVQIRRRGKVLLIDLTSEYSLVTHLKMTGQLVFDGNHVHFGAGHPGPSLLHVLPDKTTRVTLSFSDGSHLYFNDQRKFGWMRLCATSDIGSIEFFSRIGPEPLDSSFTWEVMKKQMLRRAKSKVKVVLMDQSVIAGVGNIYADESLWGAKLHPSTMVSALSDTDFKHLHKSLLKSLKLSLEKGGSTDRNYVNAEGGRGSYLNFANVFRRQGQPCLRCGTVLAKIKVGGRGTHFCPKCQKIKLPKI